MRNAPPRTSGGALRPAGFLACGFKRDLEVSLALAFPGSPVRVSILAEMAAIDAEMGQRRPVARPET